MKITNIIEETKSISSNIKNAYIDFSKMTISLVAVCSDVIKNGKPVIGYGFNSNGRYGQGHLIRERFRPRLLEALPKDIINEDATNFDPHKMWNIMMKNEKPGGHGERSVAVGTIDMAIWDLISKIEEKPLYQVLAEKYGNSIPNRNVFVYAAGGYYWPDQGLQGLTDEIKKYLDLGYSVVKKKIGGASLSEDLKRIEAILKILGPNDQLAVDANGRFDLETAISYGKALSDYNLFWYEEPGDPLDFELHKELSQHYLGSIATGENLFSVQDARNLIRYAGMRKEKDWLQFDCALSYGLVEYLKIIEMLKKYDWDTSRCIPHGGHQMSLAIAAGLGLGGNESYPDLFQPYGGFPDGVKVENSYIKLPEINGIGFEGKSDLFSIMKMMTD
jgi:L-alanine-DL-glutamate epimerase-like enolase superfamily enzyme